MNVSSKRLFFYNSTISVIGSLFAGVLNYAFHFLVSRKISVAQYGELQTLLSLVSVLGIFSATFLNATIRSVSGLWVQKKTAELATFMASTRVHIYSVAGWLLLLLVVSSFFLLRLFHLQSYFGLLFVSGAVVVGLIASIENGLINGVQDFTHSTLASTISTFIKLVIGVLMAWLFATASAVAFSLLVSGVVSFLLFRWSAHKIIPKADFSPEMPKKNWYSLEKNMLRTMLPVFIFSLLLVLCGNVDLLVMKNVASSQVVGFYGAFETLGNILLFVSGAVTGVILPRASGEGHSGKPLNASDVWFSYSIISLVGLVGIIFYYSFPIFIVKTLFGIRYLTFASDLWLFALLATAMSFLVLEATVSYARHDTTISYILGLVSLGIILGVYFNHGSLSNTVTNVIIAVSVGWVIAAFRHWLFRRNYFLITELPVINPLP